MVQEIIWTRQAKNDLEEIKNFIAIDSFFYAERTIQLIYQSCKKLLSHHQLGMLVGKEDGFELKRILVKRYRVIYTIHNNNVYIIAVYHQARLLPFKFDVLNNFFE